MQVRTCLSCDVAMSILSGKRWEVGEAFAVSKGVWKRQHMMIQHRTTFNLYFYIMYVVIIWLQQNDLGKSRPIIQPFVCRSVCSSKCFSNWCDDSSFSNSDFYIWTFFKGTTLKGDVTQSAEPRRVTVLMGSFTHPVAWLKKTHWLGRGQSLSL